MRLDRQTRVDEREEGEKGDEGDGGGLRGVIAIRSTDIRPTIALRGWSVVS